MPRTGAVALLALAVTAGLTGCDRGPDTPAAPEVAAPAIPRAAAFRVVYRVDDTAGAEPRVATDIIQVAEPWNGRLERRDGPPPGGTMLQSTVQNERFVFNTSEGSAGFATRRIPGPLATAPSPEALEAAAAAGLVERAGDATVAGEACTRWVFKAANAVLAKGTSEERVEACITGDGVPLREAITLGGKLVRVAEAVTVSRNPPVDAQTFRTDEDPGANGGQPLLESAQLVSEGRRSGDNLVEVAAPKGFRPSRQVTVTRQAGQNSPPVQLYLQAFEQGIDLVVTEQVTTPGSPPWRTDEGEVADLGDKRSGRVVYRTGWAEVRVSVGGKSVRVTSARPALALAVAKTIKS